MAKKRISSSEAEILRFMNGCLVGICVSSFVRVHDDDIIVDLFTAYGSTETNRGVQISLREFIEKRQSLKGITKRLTKAIRGKKK